MSICTVPLRKHPMRYSTYSSASEVSTLWRFTNLDIIIIIIAVVADDNLEQQENMQVAAPQVANNQVPTVFC